MANIVQNAVGTQRQFTRQPVATYQKSLRNLVASQGIINTGAGDRLYNALTGLGDAAMKFASSEEDRKRAKTVEVEQLINAATEDDWKKLSAIELLNKYGKFQLADNPYAVAAIEQARGKYMSEKFNQQYQITMAEDPIQEPEKERERYDSEKRKFLEDNKNESYDVEQYYKGFWESNPKDLLDITNQKVAEKSKNLDIMRRATFEADSSTYVRENKDKSPEEFADGLQKLIFNSVLMSLPLPDRKKAMENILEEIAKFDGSPDKIRKASEIVITNNDDGTKPVHAKDVIDLNTYIRMAGDTALARPNEWVGKQVENMLRCQSVEELDKYWKDLSPEAQEMMNPKYNSFRETLIRQEEDAKRQKVQSNQQYHKQATNDQQADNALTAYLAHHENGTYCTPEKAYGAAVRRVAAMRPGDTKTFAQIMFWEPNSRMRSEYKNAYLNSVLSATPDSINDRDNTRSVASAIALYEYNPAIFNATFDKELGTYMQTIRALGDLKQDIGAGFALFCEGRDNMARSDQLKKDAEDFADNAMSSGYTVDLKNANDPDNAKSNVSVDITSDAFSNINAKALVYLRACTQSEEAAQNLLKGMLSENYVAYDDHPFPKGVFAQKTEATNGIDASSDKGRYGAATEVMNAKVREANAENPGMHATWWWGVDDKVHFGDPNWGFDEGNGYTLDEFYDLVNQWWYNKQAEEESAAEEAESSDSSNDSSSDDSSSDDSGSSYSYTTDDGGVVTETGSHRASYSPWSWHGY
uniref:Uncharacterized protein n=1 Tax=Caudovirales sp. ctSH72 TaxID=2826773 RepID=A0A8S5QPK7_9CAUD|nr:MAG TPA: hypothetical protein [Caudovirales sp. ctSH72]